MHVAVIAADDDDLSAKGLVAFHEVAQCAIERLQVSSGSIKWLGADDHARQVARAELALKHKNSLAASAFVRDMTQSRGGRDILRAPSHLSQTPVRS